MYGLKFNIIYTNLIHKGIGALFFIIEKIKQVEAT